MPCTSETVFKNSSVETEPTLDIALVTFKEWISQHGMCIMKQSAKLFLLKQKWNEKFLKDLPGTLADNNYT